MTAVKIRKAFTLSLVTAALLISGERDSRGAEQATLMPPDTPAGKRLSEWLSIFATGDEIKFKQFITENYTPAALKESSAEDRVERQAIYYIDTHGFDLRRIEDSSAQELTALAQSKLAGLWYRLTIKVASEAPNQITEHKIDRIPKPADIKSTGPITDRRIKNELDALLKKMAAVDAFSGAVLVANNGRAFERRAVGMASKAYNIPNRTDTKFCLASVAKLFTAIAICQLAEQGKLSFDDTIGRLLPIYPNKEVAKKVTVHQLLTHTSGIGDIFGEKLVQRREHLRQVADYFQLFVDEPLAFKPGKRWQYSNAGLIVEGAIIERLSGENFFDYVHNHIFEPAGMSSTAYYEADVDVSNLATGYTNFVRNLNDIHFTFHLGPRRNISLVQPLKGGPFGGAYSTIDDMYLFSIALRDHRLLNPEYTQIMTSPKVPEENPGLTQAYEFVLENVNGTPIIGHTGGDLGTNAFFDIYPTSGYTVIVLSNYDRRGNLIAAKCRDLITQK